MTDTYAATIYQDNYNENETNNKSLKKMYKSIRKWKGKAFYIYFDNSNKKLAKQEAKKFIKQFNFKGKYKVFFDDEKDVFTGVPFSEAIFLVKEKDFNDIFMMASLIYGK